MFKNEDLEFMQLALAQARCCKGEDERTHPRVGVVVAREGKLIESAYRGELGPGEHAEFTVLERKLPEATLRGATIYTTLEPCTARSHGKLACAHRLIERRVARVFVGMLDPNPDICGKGIWLLRDAQVPTEFFPHELMSELEELNREFIRTHRPPSRIQVLTKSIVETKPPIIHAAEPETALTPPKNQAEGERDLFDRMFDAMWDKRFDEGKQLYEEMRALESDAAKLNKLRVIYLHLLYRGNGDEGALAELETLATSEHAKGFAYGALGSIALLSDSYELAAEKFRLAASHEEGDRAASWLIDAAEAERKLENRDSEISLLCSAYQNATSLTTKARAVTALATAYDQQGKTLAKATLLAKAAQLTPTDLSRKFDAAYSLADTSLSELSAFYYNKALERDGKNGSALNNLGVECIALGMKGKAIRLYEESLDAGETLAAANLARAYMNAGFFRDATLLLDKASQLQNPHANVSSARAALAERKSDETTKWSSILEIAARQHTFATGYAEALLNRETFAWAGVKWRTHDNEIIEFESRGPLLTCEWGESNTSNRRRLTITTYGNIGDIKLERWSVAFKFYSDDVKGMAFLSNEGKQLRILPFGQSPILTWNSESLLLEGRTPKELTSGSGE